MSRHTSVLDLLSQVCHSPEFTVMYLKIKAFLLPLIDFWVVSQSDQTTLTVADVSIVLHPDGLPVRLYAPLSGQLCIGADRFRNG